MKNLKVLFPVTLLICLIACTPQESGSVSNPTSTSITPALKEVVPETASPQPDPTAEMPLEDDVTTDDDIETGSASPAEVDLSQVTSQPAAEASPQVAPQPGVPDPQAAVAHEVSQDLAARLGADVGDVAVVSVEDIEWPDSSLGCPEPGIMYVSVVTPGYLVTLELSGGQHSYHTDLEGNYVLCGDDGQPIVP